MLTTLLTLEILLEEVKIPKGGGVIGNNPPRKNH
jgi:hypothetical protein